MPWKKCAIPHPKDTLENLSKWGLFTRRNSTLLMFVIWTAEVAWRNWSDPFVYRSVTILLTENWSWQRFCLLGWACDAFLSHHSQFQGLAGHWFERWRMSGNLFNWLLSDWVPLLLGIPSDVKAYASAEAVAWSYSVSHGNHDEWSRGTEQVQWKHAQSRNQRESVRVDRQGREIFVDFASQLN